MASIYLFLMGGCVWVEERTVSPAIYICATVRNELSCPAFILLPSCCFFYFFAVVGYIFSSSMQYTTVAVTGSSPSWHLSWSRLR